MKKKRMMGGRKRSKADKENGVYVYQLIQHESQQHV